jgi:hypothetical protein
MITKLGVTLGLAIMFAAPCFAQDAASQKFLKEAIEGNFAEVEMGQLTKKQASSDVFAHLARCWRKTIQPPFKRPRRRRPLSA